MPPSDPVRSSSSSSSEVHRYVLRGFFRSPSGTANPTIHSPSHPSIHWMRAARQAIDSEEDVYVAGVSGLAALSTEYRCAFSPVLLFCAATFSDFFGDCRRSVAHLPKTYGTFNRFVMPLPFPVPFR